MRSFNGATALRLMCNGYRCGRLTYKIWCSCDRQRLL